MKWLNEEYEPTDANIYSAECSICRSIAIAYGRVPLSYQFCPCCGEPVEKEAKNDDGKSLQKM